MNAGGSLEIAQRIAGHSQLSTTKIYDRSRDRLTMAEIEGVCFEPSSKKNVKYVSTDVYLAALQPDNDLYPVKKRRRAFSSLFSY
jgi:hypothetical protein